MRTLCVKPSELTRALVALALVLSCVVADGARAAITLDADFDHGSLKSYTVGTGLAPNINLVGRDNFYGGGRWRWLNFNANGVQNTRPTFRISDNFAGGGSALNGHPMVYSYDGSTWNFFDNNTRSGGTYSFFNNAGFTSNTVQIAYAPAYSYGDSVAHTQRVIASPFATPTLSGDANGVIGRSPGGTDDLGRTVTPKDIYAYRITNTATDAPGNLKRSVVVTTGMHAGETLGTHTYQGLIDWLISDDPRAAKLRDIAEFYAYPTMNPDGRFAGNSRATINNPNRDPNGFWNPSLWQNQLDIRENGEAMIADTAATRAATGKIDAFIDFHSTIPSFPGDDFAFIEYEQGDNNADFWLALKALQPNVLDIDSTSTNWTSANFAEAFLAAEVDITFETQFGFERPLSYYHTLGQNFGLAFHNAWVPEPGTAIVALMFFPMLTRQSRR